MQMLNYEEWKGLDDNAAKPARVPLEVTLSRIPSLARTGPWLVGGTIRRLLAGENLSTDFDIMFKNVQQFEDFCGQMRERGYEVLKENEHHTTFDVKGDEVQAIRAEFSNTLIQTLNKFDFTICQFGFDGTNLVWGDHSMEHLEKKLLVYTQTGDPISTMCRAFKYANQGFFMDRDVVSKFLKSVVKQEADLEKACDKWATGGTVTGRNTFQGWTTVTTDSYRT